MAETGSEQQSVAPLPLVCFSTAPSMEIAQQLADAVLEQGLAACVSCLPGALSVYRWNGAICKDTEVWIMIKTTPQAYIALQQAWKTLHPYEVPELLAVQAQAGLPAYVHWVNATVGLPGSSSCA